MRRLPHTVLATLAIALCIAPAAAAGTGRHGRNRPIVTPTTGAVLGEYWAQIYALPAPDNPFIGNGDPCLTVARGVLQEATSGVTCTVVEGTAFATAFGGECSDVEPPPFFGADAAQQRACAIAGDHAFVVALQVSVDGAAAVDIHRRPFERVSPQRTVRLPADNLLGIAPQRMTLVAHGWGAIVRNLGVGHHVVTVDLQTADGGGGSFPHFIDVVPRHGRERPGPGGESGV